MNKKFILPGALLLAGLGFLAYPLFVPSGDIDLKIQPAAFIMPAAYKVYGNPDVAGGRYNLFKAVIKNTGASEIKNLKVQYRIPKMVDEWTDVPATANLLPGQTAVVTCFPVLPQNITERNTSSKEKADIKITYGAKANPTERDESFNFDVTSVNDIVFTSMSDQDKAYVGDVMENCPLYACMVSAEDPIIKHYAESIQQRILCGEQGASVGVGGEVTEDQKNEKIRVMEGVYNATLLSHMVYSETSTNLTKFGDNTTSTEHIRLPREVVSGNTGLCIELALLHASVYKAAGLHPVIFLIPGHAFPGIKVGNDYLAIESTGIGGAGLGGMANAQQARARGDEEMKTFWEQRAQGNQAYQLLDIDELYNEGYKDMELTPDPIQSEQVEKVIAQWPACLVTALAEANENAARKEETSNTNNSRREEASWRQYSAGAITFNYPAHWKAYQRPLAQLPQLVTAIMAPDRSAQIEVFGVPGAQNAEQAMAFISDRITRLGENVQYQVAGSGGGWTRFNGTSSARGRTVSWSGFFRNADSGVEGVVVGTAGNLGSPLMTEIINSIK